MKAATKHKVLAGLLLLSSLALMSACASKKNVHTKNFEVVKNFDIEKYSGQWYEIARMDFKYEKDLKNVTANYSIKDNGDVQVLNKGYNYVKNEWKESKGKAKFNGSKNQGALKVSFFGPFYSEYNVVMMSPDYQNALIFGESLDYIWILSREKTISKQVKDKFIQYATEHGYDINKIVWTIQEANY